MYNNIAVLLTCFNRKDLTIKCLVSLFNVLPDVNVFLVDDGSSDGTSITVENQFPNVHLIQGSGNLYWNRGMHLAWKAALPYDFDYYLWLNDDVVLYSYFFQELMTTFKLSGSRNVVVGLVEDFNTKKVIYGGVDSNLNRISSTGLYQEIYLMNGNIALIPRMVVKAIGILDPFYHHDLGDLDFGLRARKNGFKLYSTSKAVASGIENNINRFRIPNSSLLNRFKRLYSPLGANPIKFAYFKNRHYSFFSGIYWFFYLNFINILPDYIYTIFKNK